MVVVDFGGFQSSLHQGDALIYTRVQRQYAILYQIMKHSRVLTFTTREKQGRLRIAARVSKQYVIEIIRNLVAVKIFAQREHPLSVCKTIFF